MYDLFIIKSPKRFGWYFFNIKQLSRSTSIATPFSLEWAFRCFNAERLEGEVHKKLQGYRISKDREFFAISLISLLFIEFYWLFIFDIKKTSIVFYAIIPIVVIAIAAFLYFYSKRATKKGWLK